MTSPDAGGWMRSVGATSKSSCRCSQVRHKRLFCPILVGSPKLALSLKPDNLEGNVNMGNQIGNGNSWAKTRETWLSKVGRS